jgi:hypothetical protein
MAIVEEKLQRLGIEKGIGLFNQAAGHGRAASVRIRALHVCLF